MDYFVTHSGTITIDGIAAGSRGLKMERSYLAGTVHVLGDVAGQIQTGGTDILDTGRILIDGSLADSGVIGYGTGIEPTPTNDIAGLVLIGGDCAGVIRLGGELSGRIRINGSLASGAQLEFGGGMSESGAVTIDDDGWDAGNDWEVGASILVGHTEYTGPSTDPEIRLWETSACVGDMTNDGSVDILDINPFILAVAGGTAYEQAWPGLGHWENDHFVANALFHADATCDGSVNILDINPFTALVANCCCDATCDHCGEQNMCSSGGGEGLFGGAGGANGNGVSVPPAGDAASVAAWWFDNVAPENYDALLAVAAAMVDYYQNQPEAEAWILILQALDD
ncbi:hypothetical protein RAS1_19940 [Phycisphaerae bacterium RAS1]|nr:hypothetical protein RAS1_19940 [Phycisphaerae bacterium RAS1]